MTVATPMAGCGLSLKIRTISTNNLPTQKFLESVAATSF
jgi:hypothetical protein